MHDGNVAYAKQIEEMKRAAYENGEPWYVEYELPDPATYPFDEIRALDSGGVRFMSDPPPYADETVRVRTFKIRRVEFGRIGWVWHKLSRTEAALGMSWSITAPELERINTPHTTEYVEGLVAEIAPPDEPPDGILDKPLYTHVWGAGVKWTVEWRPKIETVRVAGWEEVRT